MEEGKTTRSKDAPEENKKANGSERFKNISLGIAGLISSVFIPALGIYFTQAQKESEIAKSYIEIGINILNSKPQSNTDSLRTWAANLINHYSAVKLTGQAKSDVINKIPLYVPQIYSEQTGTLPTSNTPEYKNITEQQLKFIFPAIKLTPADSLVIRLNKLLPLYQITTPERKAMFIAEIGFESVSFFRKEENLNYPEAGLLRVFPAKFNKTNVKDYVNNPQKIANRIYADKMGNGNEESGDGWRFRGRGYFFLTGRSIYEELSKSAGIDFLNNPDLLLNSYPLSGACWYWKKRGLNPIADKGDLVTVTKILFGGNHISEKMAIYERAKKMFEDN